VLLIGHQAPIVPEQSGQVRVDVVPASTRGDGSFKMLTCGVGPNGGRGLWSITARVSASHEEAADVWL
jgi:hypothetical protein